jgi:hypothetical protein
MDTHDYSFATPYLSPGEAILWRGKPGKGHLLTGQDVFAIPFSIFWCGFAIFWEVTVLSTNSPFFFKLLGIPFVCVGLYLVFGRFLWTAYARKHTAYVITNQKIIRQRWNKIDIIHGRSLPAIHVSAYKDGSGTITFGANFAYSRPYQVRGAQQYGGIFAMENIPEIAKVQALIQNMEH